MLMIDVESSFCIAGQVLVTGPVPVLLPSLPLFGVIRSMMQITRKITGQENTRRQSGMGYSPLSVYAEHYSDRLEDSGIGGNQ